MTQGNLYAHQYLENLRDHISDFANNVSKGNELFWVIRSTQNAAFANKNYPYFGRNFYVLGKVSSGGQLIWSTSIQATSIVNHSQHYTYGLTSDSSGNVYLGLHMPQGIFRLNSRQDKDRQVYQNSQPYLSTVIHYNHTGDLLRVIPLFGQNVSTVHSAHVLQADSLNQGLFVSGWHLG
ncbi:MAG: hypothetical protein AAGJ35_10490, partial [Myxococcota bacterium]